MPATLSALIGLLLPQATPCTSWSMLCSVQDFLDFPSACRCCRTAAHPPVNGGSPTEALPLPSACGAMVQACRSDKTSSMCQQLQCKLLSVTME